MTISSSWQFPDGRVLQPKVVDEVVQVIADSHLQKKLNNDKTLNKTLVQ